MTREEQVHAVATQGFTQRQAGFLVTVMLHSGVCLGRQYCAFSRIAYGQVMHDFFGRLLARGFATAWRCGLGRARIYHIHHKRLYRAIDEGENRHRRPTSLPRAVEKLMLLDAVLADRSVQWLGSEHDKVRHFTLGHRIPLADLPALTFPSANGEGSTVRYFTEKLPIGVGSDRRAHVFPYLVTCLEPYKFRTFLERHAELLRALPEWTVRLLIPRHVEGAIDSYRDAFREQLATPLRPAVRDELQWYFHARRSPAERRGGRFARARRAFGTARFQTIYRAWLERGDVVLNATQSPVLADAIERQTSRLECYALPHQYLHLLSLVGTA